MTSQFVFEFILYSIAALAAIAYSNTIFATPTIEPAIADDEFSPEQIAEIIAAAEEILTEAEKLETEPGYVVCAKSFQIDPVVVIPVTESPAVTPITTVEVTELDRLSAMTVKQLRAECKDRGIKGYSKASMDTLIQLLSNHTLG